MLDVTIHADRVQIGRSFSIGFERTLRIPDDGRDHPLPPSLGRFPVRRVADYADRVPAKWREHGGVLLPMYQREAMWLSFSGAHWRPNAVKVAIGKVNAISGEPYHQRLQAGSEDYVVVPGPAVAGRHQRRQRLHPPVRGHAARHGLHRRRPGHGR